MYGLDGILGAIVGGAVTAGAVLWTLQHEQKRGMEQALDDESLRLHRVARKLSEFALLGDNLQYGFAWWDFTRDVNDFGWAARNSAPVFADLLEATAREIGRNGASTGDEGMHNRQDLLANLQNAEKLLYRKVYSPDYFEMTEDQIENTRSAIAEGAFLG